MDWGKGPEAISPGISKCLTPPVFSVGFILHDPRLGCMGECCVVSYFSIENPHADYADPEKQWQMYDMN